MYRFASGLDLVYKVGLRLGKCFSNIGTLSVTVLLSVTPESHAIPITDSWKPWLQVRSLLPGDEQSPGKFMHEDSHICSVHLDAHVWERTGVEGESTQAVEQMK